MDLDLFDDNFPHGTLAGYSKGCSGLTCPLEHDPEYLSCREVSKAVQGQGVVRIGRFDKVPRGGAPVRPVPRPPAAPIPAPSPIAAHISAEMLADTFTPDVVDEIHSGTQPLILTHPPVDEPNADNPTEDKPKRGRKPGPIPEHGTVARYQRGCRDDCPNAALGLQTCRQASAAARRSRGHVQTSIAEAPAATDLSAPAIEPEPAPEETSVPDTAPTPEAAVDVVEAGYPDDIDHPSAQAEIKSSREIELEGQLQRVNGEKIRLEQDLERANAEIARADRQHKADDALIQESRRRDAELVVADTGGESPPALAESIELTVRGVHLSLPADSGLEVRALGDAVFVRAGR